MTAKEMERKLVELSARYRLTGDEAVRQQYKALHGEWMAAKPAQKRQAPTSGEVR